MRAFGIILGVIAIGVLVVLALGSDVDVRDPGEMPEVDVSVDTQGGRMPEAEYTPPDVDVREERADVNLPDVDVEMEERTVEYPTIDYEAAEDSPVDEASEAQPEERE